MLQNQVGDQLRSKISLPHSMPQRAQLDFQVGVTDIGISRVMSPTQHDTNSLVIVKLTDLQAELALMRCFLESSMCCTVPLSAVVSENIS